MLIGWAHLHKLVSLQTGFEKEFSSETHRFWVWYKRRYFILMWKKFDSLLVEKQKDFADQKCTDSQPEKSFE